MLITGSVFRGKKIKSPFACVGYVYFYMVWWNVKTTCSKPRIVQEKKKPKWRRWRRPSRGVISGERSTGTVRVQEPSTVCKWVGGKTQYGRKCRQSTPSVWFGKKKHRQTRGKKRTWNTSVPKQRRAKNYADDDDAKNDGRRVYAVAYRGARKLT